MEELKKIVENTSQRFILLSKKTKIILIVALALVVIGVGGGEMLGGQGQGFGGDGPGFGGEGQHMSESMQNGNGMGGNDGEGGRGGKEGATRTLSGSMLQLGLIGFGMIVIVLILKPKKIAPIKQHVLRANDEEQINE